MHVSALVLPLLAVAAQAGPAAPKAMAKPAVAAEVVPGGEGAPCPNYSWDDCSGALVCQLGACADPAKKKTPTPPADPAKWRDLITASHNTYRARHGAKDLKWNDELASKAQTMANSCATSVDPKLGFFGYNGYYSSVWYEPDNFGNSGTAVSASDLWYSSVKNYNFANPGWNPNAGTFTQMVWKSSLFFGCAVYQAGAGQPRCGGYSAYFLCLYSPSGNTNVNGGFPANVSPAGTKPPTE